MQYLMFHFPFSLTLFSEKKNNIRTTLSHSLNLCLHGFSIELIVFRLICCDTPCSISLKLIFKKNKKCNWEKSQITKWQSIKSTSVLFLILISLFRIRTVKSIHIYAYSSVLFEQLRFEDVRYEYSWNLTIRRKADKTFWFKLSF